MIDQMNNEQYRKACRYRVQETLENLAGIWHVPDERITPELRSESLDWLERTVDELKYFREKLETTGDEPSTPGALPR